MGKVAHAAPAKTPPSAKPGTVDPVAEKPAKVKPVFYPGLEAKPVVVDGKPKLNKAGKEIVRPTKKLDAVPADYDPKKHKPLGKADFADESIFLELKAQRLEQQAADLRKQAADVKALGSIKDRGAAKKLLNLQKRIDELTKDLEGKGVDLTAIKAKLAASMAAKTEQPTQKA